MRIVNRIGLEGEFILRDSKGKIRYPAKHGFDRDDFFLLGEFRARPGENREEVVGHFMESIAELYYRAAKTDLQLDFSGVYEISPEQKADVLRKMGRKNIAEAKNIYGTDILKLSDDVVENGVITTARISAGLHVHFSRGMLASWTDKDKSTHDDWKSILTASQRRNIIVAMDNNILTNYPLGVPLKYRKPGFYEEKPHGFEYRSLPMVESMLNLQEIMHIVDFAFLQLERLDR